jgi:hypothetical protein
VEATTATESKARSEEKTSCVDPEAVKRRDASRLIRATRKISYELKNAAPAREKKKKEEKKKVFKAYITLGDRVGITHLQSRVGKREEFQTTLQKPSNFRKTLIRVFRLKGLRWTLLQRHEDGRKAAMPKLMKVLEEKAAYIVRIEDQRGGRPNAPGSSKSRHYERANQKRSRWSFSWSAPPEKGPKNEPRSHEARGS